ncbi:MAG: decarboxylating 6-phosphogluconate dehydrogenase [Bacillati bacterium ANGP1]|uniref:Decarboxylating 6-phosphogluconate dehydrogenase n=1 Tax=Candidatus Segetimicrobium genomatis TaxID=2569760 RepID=A0A537IYX6_9BACT|nr:MAG: decarboxylating 6-phosphogluconate dehydrogenase [Terrabacteria group bacterium ANGP1]
MELGMIGLGRMGANMSVRLLRAGHRVVGYDPRAESVQRLRDGGGLGAETLPQLSQQLSAPRAVWLMVPSGQPVDETIDALLPLLTRDDVIIDGGNSYYRDSMRRAAKVAERGLHFLDVGTSGGIWGLTEGFSLMVGGEREVATRLSPILQTLAPAQDRGWGYVGPSGAGHFVKMIHNGIEYGLMEAYAEGFELLRAKQQFHLDLPQIADIWRFGSVVRSWLLDLVARALHENPELEGIAAYVPDSGEGRWTLMEALELERPIPVIALSLDRRFRSRLENPFSDRLLAALRQQFGGHPVKHL